MRFSSPALVLVGGIALVFFAWGCGGSGGGAPATQPTPTSLYTFRPADYVIGQADFTSHAAASGASGVNAPKGIGSGSLYVVDSGNRRVLGFDPAPSSSGADAQFVLGQPNFTSVGVATTQTGMNWPGDVCASGGHLCVADTVNNRVMIWNSPPTTTNAPCDVVAGQALFTTNAAGTTQSGLQNPTGVWLAGGRLIVADTDNSRVLVWNAVPVANGANADLVLGQADFTSGLGNRGGAVAANTMALPWDVWSDGTRLVVADRENNRVLIWTTFPTTDGQDADLVLGQPNMTTATQGPGATGMDRPAGVCSDGTRLIVADMHNNRVLVWEVFPTANQAPADIVLGQFDFSQTTENDDDHDSAPDATPSARTLFGGFFGLSVHVDGDRLYIGDAGNHRVLVYEGL